MTNKIQAHNLERRALVYVRQSTTTQVLEHKESTARQYALVERACALGWPKDLVEIIDEDLGKSGATAKDRSGFTRLAETVAQGKAGAIFALEVSRLARSSQDWQRLLALCAVAQVVVGDEQAIYDPQNCDDKLLLDLKGTMSEVELHWLSLRMAGARQSLARRGALRFQAPAGYVWGGHGFELDPDQAVRHAIAMIFERFAIEPSVGAVARWARQTDFLVPRRCSFADGTSDLSWKPLGQSRLKEMLHSPVYAGAYAYGRRPEKKVLIDGEIRNVRRCKEDPADWPVLIQGAHQGFITWETFMSNLEKLAANGARLPSPGAPREGHALLAGILVCGRCGRRMRIAYQGRGGKRWTYVCYGDQDHAASACWLLSGMKIDAAVEDLLLRMIIPGELELTLAVEREAESQADSLGQHWKLRLEQAEYQARRAERRYKAVDPDNRVVARTLEGDWEASLRELEALRHRYEAQRTEQHVPLTDEDRIRIRALARDLPAVWRAPTTTPADRKAMLRIAIETVAIRPIDVPERKTHIQVQWRSGAVDELTVPRPRSADHSRTSAAAVDRVRILAAQALHDDDIATRLNQDKILTGRGQQWTGQIVKRIRIQHAIARTAPTRITRWPVPDRHPDGRYSISGVAKRFGVSDTIVYRWIQRGVVQAVSERYEQYKKVFWLDIDEATAARLEHAAARTRNHRNHANATVDGRGDAS